MNKNPSETQIKINFWTRTFVLLYRTDIERSSNGTLFICSSISKAYHYRNKMHPIAM